MVTIEGAHNSPIDRERLFAALTDPNNFERAIAACERVEPGPDGDYLAQVNIEVLGGRRSQEVQLTFQEQTPPEHLVIVLKATTPAGRVHGSFGIQLAPAPQGTHLEYQAEITLSGVLGSLGPRLVEVTVTRFLNEFLGELDQQLTSNA